MTCSRRKFFRTSLGAAASASLVSAAQEIRRAKAGFVTANGQNLLTPSGQNLLLRGINLGNWFVPEGYMFRFEGGPQSPREIESLFNELIGPAAAAQFWSEYRRRYITPSDIEFIKGSGLNSVRIPLHYKLFEPGADGFELLDPVIESCRLTGLWVILDLHAAPGGQTGTNIDDSWSYPWLWENTQNQEQTIEFWRRVAQHYKDEPALLGYDLLNEPIPDLAPLRPYNEKLEALYRRITSVIRQVDPHHVIILEGAQWASNFKPFGPPFDSNVVYEFHKYWMEPVQSAVKDYIDFRDRYNVPIWLGESGENTDDWIRQFTAVLETNKIGWCFWPYKKMDATSCMVSIPKPTHWDEIVAYAKLSLTTGEAQRRIPNRPSLDLSQAALNSLLNQVRLDACHKNSGFFQALNLHP